MGNIAAVVGIGTVTINSGVSAAVAGESQCTAVDGKTAVGVHAVTGGYDGKCTAVNHNKAVGAGGKCVLLSGAKSAKARAVCPTAGVEAVVIGCNIKHTVLNGDRQTDVRI